MGTLRVKKVGRPIYLKLVTLLSLERKQKKNTYRKMDKTQKYTLICLFYPLMLRIENKLTYFTFTTIRDFTRM